MKLATARWVNDDTSHSSIQFVRISIANAGGQVQGIFSRVRKESHFDIQLRRCA